MSDLRLPSRPMRILLATLGSRGDVEPFLWLAHALRDAGHEVRSVIPDDVEGPVTDLDVVRLGVTFEDLADAGREPGESALRAFRERIRPAMSHALATVVTAAIDWEPQLIVSHPKLLTVPVVAAHLDIPYAVVELTPTLTPTGEFPAAGVAARSFGPVLNRLTYRAIGAAGAMFRADIRRARSRLGISSSRRLSPPAGSLVAVSPSLLPRPTDWPTTAHITGDWHGTPEGRAQIDAELRDFIEADEPFLYAGLGSMTGGDASARAEAIIDGARQSGLRVLMATGWGGLEPPRRCLGPDDLVTRSVPHAAVLPHAVAALHHGGAGTVHAVTRAGVPSIVVPFLADQPFWAAQLHRLGLAGRPLRKDRLTAVRVRTAIADAVDYTPRIRDTARLMADEEGATTAAEIISTMT